MILMKKEIPKYHCQKYFLHNFLIMIKGLRATADKAESD